MLAGRQAGGDAQVAQRAGVFQHGVAVRQAVGPVDRLLVPPEAVLKRDGGQGEGVQFFVRTHMGMAGLCGHAPHPSSAKTRIFTIHAR